VSGVGGVMAAVLVAGGRGAAGDGIVEQWRDMGPRLWIMAAGVTALWFALFGVLAALTNPRGVRPGAETLDLAGDEPPAVVNLVTRDWRLGHEAVPATLLDLAARGRLAIDQVGDRTLVRVVGGRPAATGPAATGSAGPGLTGYEDMVLDHVRGLAGHTADGAVPAEVLTTGPGDGASGWWRRFQGQVHADARARGLSRPRWSLVHRTILTVAAVAAATAVGLAVSTVPDDPDDGERTNPVAAAVGVGAAGFSALMVLVANAERPRDTPEGRAAAARWLGLREMLAHNPLFSEHPPAGVAIWGRHLAHGAALGLAHGAVGALPLGAESDDEAWSPVGGRWRVVRVRYPRWTPPGYGRHPAVAVLGGLAQLAAGAGLAVLALRLTGEGDGGLAGPGVDDDPFASARVELAARIGAAVAVALGALLAARGAWMLLAGAADVGTGRRTVVGRVLRRRVRGSEDHQRWYVAVDEEAVGEEGTGEGGDRPGGTARGDEIRAWLLRRSVAAPQGVTVRASVTRWLRHVRDIEVVPDPAG